MKMRFNDFEFPANPAKLEVFLSSNFSASPVFGKGSSVQNVSVNPAVIKGSGEFFGSRAESSCCYMQHMLRLKKAGTLYVPSSGSYTAYLTEFNFFRNADKSSIAYSFVFTECCRGRKESRLFCDCQKNYENEEGYEISMFARSSACILVDNETVAYTYEKPSAKQLCHCIAKKYGFSCELPEIYSDFKYQVPAGSSCYGAISRFVSLLTDGFIYITPENKIRLQKIEGGVKGLNSYDVLSAVQTFNRSEPISGIAFKKTANDVRYNMHTEIHPDIGTGTEREIYINLSSLPGWQRDNTVLKKLRKSYENYDVLEVTVAGYAQEGLMQICSLATDRHRYDNYYLAEKKFMLSQKGEFTKLVLRKNISFKEITYVDK